MENTTYEPRILVYFCNKCCGPNCTRDHLSLNHISDSITSVHFKCAREVTPQQIRRGFAQGADGILICGCLVRDCENSPDDLAVLSSMYRNQIAVKQAGVACGRLREEWVVQGTTDHLENIITDFCRRLKQLGPMPRIERAAVAKA